MSKVKKSRLLTLLIAFLFATTAYAANKPDSLLAPESQGQAPNANQPSIKPVEPALPPNAEVAAPIPPTLPNIDPPLTTTTKADETRMSQPIAGTLTNLPASKRIAISILAGVLTLVAALWIGARRD